MYLPSPLFLLLPDQPFVLRHSLCSVYFRGLLQPKGFGCISSPSLQISCFTSVSSLLNNSGFYLVFVGELVERLVLCKQQRRPPNTISGCFGLLHFTTSKGPDLSQLRPGRTGCCPSHRDLPTPSLWSLARYAKPEPEHVTLSVQAVDDRTCPIITIWFQHFWIIRQKDDKLPLYHPICAQSNCSQSCFKSGKFRFY